MYERHVLPLLIEALTDTPVVVLNGARQTGKSTLAQRLSTQRGLRYLTLDDRVVLAATCYGGSPLAGDLVASRAPTRRVFALRFSCTVISDHGMNTHVCNAIIEETP